MSSSTAKLTQYAQFWRNAAPQGFADFLAAFEEYTNKKTQDCIDSTENIQLAQGHAQQCRAILNALREVKNG